VVTGRIDRGIVKVNDEVEIVGLKPTVKTTCTAWKCSASSWTKVKRATTWACCCAARSRRRGTRPSAGEARLDHPHTQFEAEVYVLTKEEGGRHTPFFKGYRPQFYFRTTDVTGACELPAGVEMVMPGDNIRWWWS